MCVIDATASDTTARKRGGRAGNRSVRGCLRRPFFLATRTYGHGRVPMTARATETEMIGTEGIGADASKRSVAFQAPPSIPVPNPNPHALRPSQDGSNRAQSHQSQSWTPRGDAPRLVPAPASFVVTALTFGLTCHWRPSCLSKTSRPNSPPSRASRRQRH